MKYVWCEGRYFVMASFETESRSPGINPRVKLNIDSRRFTELVFAAFFGSILAMAFGQGLWPSDPYYITIKNGLVFRVRKTTGEWDVNRSDGWHSVKFETVNAVLAEKDVN
jgi:hypothetical protein